MHAKGGTKTRIGRPIRLITALMLAVSGMLVALTFYSGRAMDEVTLHSERALVDNALTERIERGLGELRSVSWWDDAVLYTSAKAFDRTWLDDEIGNYIIESYKHDRLMVLDEQNRPVYAYGEKTGLGTVQLRRDLTATTAIVRQARGGKDVSPRIKSAARKGELYESVGSSARRYSRGFGGIIDIDGQPAIAIAALITPTEEVAGRPPTRRIMLSIIDITPEVLHGIGKTVLLRDLGYVKLQGAARGQLQLRTDAGALLRPLNWTTEQPGSEMVEQVLPYIFVALAMASILMGLLFTWLSGATRDLAVREREAQRLANHDALTGLPNRRKLEFEMSSRVGKADRSLACAVLDLDRFKDINDTLGHAAGDALIIAVGARLVQHLRSSDFVARLGGDEFAVLRDCRSADDANDLESSLNAAFARPFPVMGHLIETGASVGVSLSGADRLADDPIREADIALYEAKGRDKGTIVRFAPAMGDKIAQRRSLEIELKQAVSDGKLTLVYQPIIEAASGAIASVEALVRWSSPHHGIVPPDVFIAIAEETGIMADLGRFVIDQAIADSKRWPEISTSINISPAQLRSATILHDLIDPIRKHGVSASQITLEVTETVLLSNDARTVRVLNILKGHGFGLALDDFGTGYSSLAYMRDFPFDKLKIDRSFVTGRCDSQRSVDIVEAVVNFGRILGREVVAEGIETEQEMQAMQRVGVTHLQGYLFSKPISADHVEALIATSGRLTAVHAPRVVSNLPPIVEPAMKGRLRAQG